MSQYSHPPRRLQHCRAETAPVNVSSRWLGTKPQGCNRDGPVPPGMPQKKPRSLAVPGTRADCRQGPQWLRSRFGAGKKISWWLLQQLLPAQTLPRVKPPYHPATSVLPAVQKPLVEETEAFLLLILALATANHRDCRGQCPHQGGAGNTAWSEGCSNKQEPVKSHPSQH